MRDIYGSSVVTSNEQTQISTNEDILPSTTDAIDIGSATKRFRNGVFKSCTVNGSDVLTTSSVIFTPEINSRLSDLELKTQNQSAASSITTFNNQVNASIIRVQAISSETDNPFDRVTIGTGNDTVGIASLNGITSKKFKVESGLSTEFLKGDGTVDSNSYLSTTSAGIVSGYPFNPAHRATTTITSSTKSFYFTILLNQSCLISGFTVYLDQGSDIFRMGIYRGNLVSGSPNIILCGQSAGGILNATTVFNRVTITAVSGQNLSFTSGEYMTIAFHSQGSTNVFIGSPNSGTNWTDLVWTSSANYASSGFPATLGSLSATGSTLSRPCFELY